MTGPAPHRIKSITQITLAAALFTFPAWGQKTEPPSGNPAISPFAYEVISIRPHKDNGNYSHWGIPTTDGYKAYNYFVYDLIFRAYELKCQDQLIGLPQWGYDKSFDIEAKLGEAQAAVFQRLSERERLTQTAPLLRAMLEERFGLRVHHETRVLPVYELVVARSGFKLKQADGPENLYNMTTRNGGIRTPRSPIGARFIVGLSGAIGRIVIDKTGLTGWYDIDLKWTPDGSQTSDPNAPPDLFTALEEQLGLKLVATKAPVDVIVVDHVERPTEN
jgi:uncharacterized protein (TIGR03435 family)